MSLINNAKKISETHGIDAVVVWKPSERVEFGDAQWYDLLAGAIDLLALTTENFARLYVGNSTVVAQREGEEVIAVTVKTGHPIIKSLRRMLRRAARKSTKETAERYCETANMNPAELSKWAKS